MQGAVQGVCQFLRQRPGLSGCAVGHAGIGPEVRGQERGGVLLCFLKGLCVCVAVAYGQVSAVRMRRILDTYSSLVTMYPAPKAQDPHATKTQLINRPSQTPPSPPPLTCTTHQNPLTSPIPPQLSSLLSPLPACRNKNPPISSAYTYLPTYLLSISYLTVPYLTRPFADSFFFLLFFWIFFFPQLLTCPNFPLTTRM